MYEFSCEARCFCVTGASRAHRKERRSVQLRGGEPTSSGKQISILFPQSSIWTKLFCQLFPSAMFEMINIISQELRSHQNLTFLYLVCTHFSIIVCTCHPLKIAPVRRFRTICSKVPIFLMCIPVAGRTHFLNACILHATDIFDLHLIVFPKWSHIKTSVSNFPDYFTSCAYRIFLLCILLIRNSYGKFYARQWTNLY